MNSSKAGLYIITFITCLFHSQNIKAQKYTLNAYNIKLKVHSGFVMNHSKNMAHLANQRPYGFEIDVSKPTTGKKLWHQLYKYPSIGYAFQAFRMDPEKPLGNIYSAVIYFSKDLYSGKRSRLTYKFGTGPSLTNKRFNQQQNYKNNLISSRINIAIQGDISYTYITGPLSLSMGIGLMHYSNGAIKVPNLGINIPSVHFDIGFNSTRQAKIFQDSLPPLNKKIRFNFTSSFGLKEVYPIGGPKYSILALSSYAGKPINRKSELNFGFDFFYNESAKIDIDDVELTYSDIPGNYLQFALIGGHELIIGKAALLLQLGYYLHDPLKRNKIIYQRFGLKYYFKENLFAATSLKTHFGNADFIEWGIGYRL